MNGCRLVVVIPIVWELCVWLRPVGVVSIASCSIQQRTSHRYAWAYFLAIDSFRLLFSDAPHTSIPLLAIFIISTEIPLGLKPHSISSKSFFFSFPPLFSSCFFFFFWSKATSNSYFVHRGSVIFPRCV